jgi:UDP-N-acetylmuramoylalanine--D-glutamate ligase
MKALLYGVAVTGSALGDALHRRGATIAAADDSPDVHKRACAAAWGSELVDAPDERAVAALVGAADVVCPAPGIPETHRVIRAALAADVPIRSEIDLAYEWEQSRMGGPRPMLAVTGTDGKTTTTLMAAAILGAAGMRAVAVGNTEVPLAAEIDGPADVFVVECSSFRLAWTRAFRAEASVWLNLADDHQNWHTSMRSYEAAKARMWRHTRHTDVAVGFAGDDVVLRNLRAANARKVLFGRHDAAEYAQRGDELQSPSGVLAHTSAMSRAMPHDVTNALAAAAVCVESGLAAPADVAAAMASFRHPEHRIEPVATIAGVSWWNDSKATTPHAALTAIRSFDRLVLLAGGRNKGLDLSSLASEHSRVRAVVALGESAADVEAAFTTYCPVRTAGSMDEAVALAASLAEPGDAVLLSPGCASFDWYPNGGYPARGDHFKALVHELALAKGVA